MSFWKSIKKIIQNSRNEYLKEKKELPEKFGWLARMTKALKRIVHVRIKFIERLKGISEPNVVRDWNGVHRPVCVLVRWRNVVVASLLRSISTKLWRVFLFLFLTFFQLSFYNMNELFNVFFKFSHLFIIFLVCNGS